MTHQTLRTLFFLSSFFLGFGVLSSRPNIIDYRHLDEAPNVVKKGSLVYPKTFAGFFSDAYVLLWVTIAEDGSVYQVEVLGSVHPNFTESAINALLETTFTPPLFKKERVGTQIPLSVRYTSKEAFLKFEQVIPYKVLSGDDFVPEPGKKPPYPAPGLIEFRTLDRTFNADVLNSAQPPIAEGGGAMAVNDSQSLSINGVGVDRNDSQGWSIFDQRRSLSKFISLKESVLEGPLPYTKAPEVTLFYFPIFPLEKIVSGKGRENVVVSWIVDPNGFPIDPTADPDADPDYARAAEAAIRYWRFLAGELEGRKTTAGVAYSFPFDRFHLDRKKKRLARRLYEGTIEFRNPSELDDPLHLRVKQKIVFPRMKDREKGYADIKVHIAPDGRSFFPEIIETNNEAIAWSALTAITQWRFAPPTIDGEPVYVVFQQRFEN